jgi:hypothetical protein
MMTLAQMACAVLNTADGREKTALSRGFAAQWSTARAAGDDVEIGTCSPPDMPARPKAPELRAPRAKLMAWERRPKNLHSPQPGWVF